MPADTVAIARELLKHLNSWEEKPARFTLEELNNKNYSMMLQPLSTAAKERAYVDGSFIGVLPFAVYHKAAQSDTSEKAKAYDTLEKLAYWLENSPLPELGGKRTALQIEQTGTPALAQLDEETEVYQTIFNLRYKQTA